MTHEESLKVTLEVLARHFDPPREIAATHEIQADLGLDSLAVMEIIADIEFLDGEITKGLAELKAMLSA